MNFKPRNAAAKIISERDRAKRKQMLEEVPENFRDWVKGLVVDAFEMKKYKGQR